MSRIKLAATAGVVALAIVAAAVAAVPSMLSLGPAVKAKTPTYLGYYDGHKDAYLVTDVSSKAQASGDAHQLLAGAREGQGRARRSTSSRARPHPARSPCSGRSPARPTTTRSGRS